MPTLRRLALGAITALIWGCGGQLLVDADPASCTTAGCPCAQSADCGTRLSCLEGSCVDAGPCAVDNLLGGCPSGRVCQGGVCARATGEPPWCSACADGEVCDDAACTLLTDGMRCGTARPDGFCEIGSACVNGACLAITSDNACSADRPWGLCPDEAACVDGACVPVSERPCGLSHPGGLCDGAARCQDGVCHHASCSPESRFGSCPLGQFCASVGACRPEGTCGEAADCGPHHDCVEEVCQRNLTCADDAGCMPQEHCGVAGRCLLLGRCEDLLDCHSGESCSITGVCLDEGRCADDRDCASGVCGSAGVCLSAGQCTALADCPPSHACEAGSCVPDGMPCTTNLRDPSACPEGEQCCPWGGRCSSAGVCISDGACVDDSDCLAGSTACRDFVCEPTVPCDGGCPEGTYCSFLGGCVPAGRCALDADCTSGHSCTALYDCIVGGECGSFEIQVEVVKPNVLIVLDRSGSMNLCTEETTTRWDEATRAVRGLVDRHGVSLRLGLSTYPATCPSATCSWPCDHTACESACPELGCDAGGIDVAVGEDTAGALTARLGELSPGGHTPTGPTLREVLREPSAYGLAVPGDVAERRDFILLVTDGEANCDGTGPAARVDAALDGLRALPRPVTTYVVGFGFSTVRASLNCHAVHGGGARCEGVDATSCATTESLCYFEATDEASLSAAFDAVVRTLMPCDYALDSVPPDPSRLYVFLDSGDDVRPVPRDSSHASGWDYDAARNQVSFFGPACDQIKAGTAHPHVVYGCADGGF